MTAPVGPVMPRRLRFEPILRLLLGLLFLLACAYIVLQFATLRSSLDSERTGQAAQSSAIAQLSSALKTTQDQLAAHGITPKAPPPATIVQGVPGIPGQSVVGPAGPAGLNGVSPDPAAIARMVLAMIHPTPGPKGDPGAPGAPGKDSTVAGPAGTNGKDGTNGANSTVPGPKGDPGATGATGPAPSGWTFTAADGTVYDCTPDAAGSTHYNCVARSGSGPSPTPTPVPTQTAANTAPKHAAKRPPTPVSTGPGRP